MLATATRTTGDLILSNSSVLMIQGCESEWSDVSVLPAGTAAAAQGAKCMVMFSKEGCPSCVEAEDAWLEAVQLCSTHTEDLHCVKVEFSNQDVVVNSSLYQSFKNNTMLMSRRRVVTFPTFLMYHSGELVREYYGARSGDQFFSYIEDLGVPTSRLADSISPIFPVHDDAKVLYDLYLKARDCFWIEKEIDFSKDYADWMGLSANERFFIEHILAFFAMSDQLVNINLGERFCEDITTIPKHLRNSCRLFYNLQLAMEDIHSQTYETMLNILVKDKFREADLKNAITTIPAIKKKASWATRWIDDSCSFGKRLVAFAVLEGIFFSGSFCSIFWIREKNILKGLTKSNEFIARDEGLHYTFAIELFNLLKGIGWEDLNCSSEDILEIVDEAVAIESEFITASFPCRLVGMNSESMIQYIRFVANVLMVKLGVTPSSVYRVTNPFQFMENIGMDSKANFFEERVTQYRKANSAADHSGDGGFMLDDDF